MKRWRLILIVLTVLCGSRAQADEPLEIHVFAGQHLLAAKDAGGAGVVLHLLAAWRDPATWRLVPHPVDSFEQFRKEVRALPADDAHPHIAVGMLTTRVLEAAAAGQMLAIAGTDQPFPAIDEVLKGRDVLHRDRVAWLPLGWVLWSSFESVRPPGACAPGFNWVTCVERHGPETFAISQRAGDHGWPLYGAAILRLSGKAVAANPDADALMDWLASPAAAEVLRDDFVVVAHPDVRPRRSVVFKLIDPNGAELATSYDSPHPLPRPAVDAITGTFNACGRAATCPNYLAPSGQDAAMRARVTQLLDAP